MNDLDRIRRDIECGNSVSMEDQEKLLTLCDEAITD